MLNKWRNKIRKSADLGCFHNLSVLVYYSLHCLKQHTLISYSFVSQKPDADLTVLKSRFRAVVFISREKSILAFSRFWRPPTFFGSWTPSSISRASEGKSSSSHIASLWPPLLPSFSTCDYTGSPRCSLIPLCHLSSHIHRSRGLEHVHFQRGHYSFY